MAFLWGDEEPRYFGRRNPAADGERAAKRDNLDKPAHFFNAQIRVRWIETKADGSVIVETADEFDKGTRLLLAPDQIRENA